MFEKEFRNVVEAQKQGAVGRRLEMLEKEMTGEEKMFKEVLWPVFGSFKGFIMQYELLTFTGVTMYVDAYYEPNRIAFESEGFVAHAENITRNRFDFERNRVRSMASKGITYYPYTWDEMNKKPEVCRSALYEFLGKNRNLADEGLTIYEREVVRNALLLERTVRVADVCEWIGRSADVSRGVLKSMTEKSLLKPMRDDRIRHQEYQLDERAIKLVRNQI
ncbi:hypothetical protein [Paenibacillus sp. NPDC057967]|uniref:hypothetical protein n=1 Tax=Paenibacillus sp. NPDC057967 TaxID=3346293 RepID=UPI0036DF9368